MADANGDVRFWATRSTGYNKLDWARRSDYADKVVSAGEVTRDDVVLDIGTGNGVIAHKVAKISDHVTGVDISPEMLKHAHRNGQDNPKFAVGDARHLNFEDNIFSKVFSRMMFHGLTDGAKLAASEIHRVLKPGGLFVISEGSPPSAEVGPWYTEMFKLKENRLTLFREDLVELLESVNFNISTEIVHKAFQVSIHNWLTNSGLPQERQDEIMQIHFDMPEFVRDAYNASFEENDVLLDMRFEIVVGTKSD
jgi:ubiquinone/menaquinone biosynthesis C-methylase UbiE